MGNAIDPCAVVALLEDMPTRHFETGQPILLRRGQIGTVVMAYDGRLMKLSLPVEVATPMLYCRSALINSYRFKTNQNISPLGWICSAPSGRGSLTPKAAVPDSAFW